MSAVVSMHPYDQLGLESPIAEGNDESDRYEAMPAWSEPGESPYAEDSATTESWHENQEPESVGEEGLAWLDMESESENAQAFAEDLAPCGCKEREAGESLDEYAEQQYLESEGEHSLDESPPARPALKSATVGGFGRYRSDAATLAPAERAKVSALAAYVLWSFGPGRHRVRSIELVGHADRDVARGPAFEDRMSRERALKMRAVLAEAIDQQSAVHSPSDPPWPPYSSRVDWNIVASGARQLLVANPRTEAERARNRRVDIALHSGGAVPVPLINSEVAATDASSIEWTFPIMLRFSRIVPADINANNCCRAVQTASRLLEAANPTKKSCAAFNFHGTQLITARESQPPLSSTRKCCDWTPEYWAQCAKEPHKSGCAHCGDSTGPHLILKYAKQPLQNAVERIKQALDQGCTVAAGVMSGICADKPDVGCARVAKADAWRQCPEHWVLILAYRDDTFLFWDSSGASALQTREEHRFGLFEYDRETPRLSTARSVAGADRMIVNGGGFHMAGYASAPPRQKRSLAINAIAGSQKRFQVLDLRNTAPCAVLEENKRCGEPGEKPRACAPMRVDSARETEEFSEAEFLDDEERDANEVGDQSEDHEGFEPGNEAEGVSPAGLSTPLTGEQRTWILALDRSALERLPDAAKRDRFLQQDWSDVEFPGNVPKGQSATDEIRRHWVLARSLFDAMAVVTPERRVPTTIRFRDRRTVKVPGQPSHRLFGEASDAFLRMHAAAKTEGVDLVILSSWRSRARQAAASANQPNPSAVARKASAHMYGLAIDLRMGVPGLPVKETNTRVDRATAAKAGTAAKMGNLVRMYRSPVYKWMSLRAREFGWYPYRNEPWHWEYNPPGLKQRFEGATRGELEQEARAEDSEASWEQLDETSLETQFEDQRQAPSPFLRTFTAKALGVKVAVYVTQAARRARQVEMMVFAHGLDLCKPVFKNRPETFITERPFKLGELVEATGRPIVLVVPFFDWERLDANRMAFGRKWHRLAQPANFNAVASEALEHARAITGSAAPATLQRLILAGHSRAYGFFDALAHEHASAQMRTGALASPIHVWALDTTYSAPIADWRAWLRSREDLQATVVYRTGTYRTKDSSVRELLTGVRGKEFAKLAKATNGRLTAMPVAAGKVSHCGIPTAYLPRLIAQLPALTTHGEYEAQTEYEEFEEGEDQAGHTTEAEAFEPEDEDTRNEWTEQPFNEEELDSPDRFDAFGDERDSEWEAQSEEEEQSQEDSFEEGEHDLSFALDQEEESGLAGSGLTTAEQKAVEITSLFETGKRGGFYGLTGNFDGQGLSFGLVNWTIGTGSLQPLLRDFAREHPARWLWTFGVDASRFLQLIARKDKAAQKEQHRFAVEQMNSVSIGAGGKRIWTVRQPWVGYFKRLSEDTAFQKIQIRYVRNLLASAEDYCRQFRLTSEQAFCFMFDAVSSHGKWWLKKKFSGVEKRRVMVEEALKSLAARFGEGRVPESEVLLAIADVLGTTSAQRWADKVRRRKRWFVTGEHPRGRELDELKPRADVAYSTSKPISRELESEEGDIAGESELADDAQAILGRWTIRVKNWVWEYEFSPGGKLAWRDTRSNEKGLGRWSMAPKVINLEWSNSATRESWTRPVSAAGQKAWYSSSYYTGAYVAQKVIAPASGTATDVDPSVANLSIVRYVDAFTEVKYDVNYKVPTNKAFAFSPILQAKYDDGAVVEFDINDDFSSVPMSYDDARNAIAHARLGRGGRIMPAVLNIATAPRLWRARAEALRIQDEEANAFMGTALTGIAFTLGIPAMPAGPMPAATVMSKSVTRTAATGTRVPPAPIQGNRVQIGPGNAPGSLWANIHHTAEEVVYYVYMIFLRGKDPAIPTARATHREMIRRAAIAAKSQNQSTFKMVGKDAGEEFVKHANDLANTIGVPGSGRVMATGGVHPDYEVTLVVAKVLGL